ncbi:MAG: isoprenyl transferase [Deltaproteobacteria bacterium]|nr:MAG: isoprenyl transferase [Deltaproteobacteria bacterium]
MSFNQDLDPSRMPVHIAIVMDGNGRWAGNCGKHRLFGHKAGAGSVRAVVEACCEFGVRFLTLYAFSSENWRRPEEEVSGLMSILQSFLLSELKKMQQNGVRLSCIGDIARLPAKVRKTLLEVMAETASNRKLTLNLALSYGSRDEITLAVRNIARACLDGAIQPDEIDQQLIGSHLYTRDLPDPDLLIRTGGEARLSNFLLWQSSYAEIYFTKTMWPDFGKDELRQAIIDFQSRQRRFGRTGEQIQGGKV